MVINVHVLIAHNDYAKFSGEEYAIQSLAKALEFNGHKISWYRRSSTEIGESLAKKVSAFFSGIYNPYTRARMARILNDQKVDVVQVQNLYPFLSPSVLLECKNRGIPVVMRCPNYRLFCPNGLHFSNGEICERCLGGKEWMCVLRNCEQNYFKSLGYALRTATARISRMIINNVNLFVVLSEFQKKRFIAGGISPEKIEILPNIAPVVNDGELKSNDGEFISFVGRVSAEKGITQLIDAAKSLARHRFCVAGSLNGMPQIVKAAPKNVQFQGFLSGHKLAEVFRKSRMIVVPSTWFEGFPNVITMAMAHEKPVVASRIGSIPEIVDDGITGLLFEPGNAEDLVEKIQFLWNRPELCRDMGHAALQKAKRKYSEERYYARLMAIYNKANHLNASNSMSF